jgi:hypothetical protein
LNCASFKHLISLEAGGKILVSNWGYLPNLSSFILKNYDILIFQTVFQQSLNVFRTHERILVWAKDLAERADSFGLTAQGIVLSLGIKAHFQLQTHYFRDFVFQFNYLLLKVKLLLLESFNLVLSSRQWNVVFKLMFATGTDQGNIAWSSG